jgi:urate oxidase
VLIFFVLLGPPDTGVFSPSIQNTLYIAQKEVLERVPQMSHIEVELPNKHYVPVDFSKFSRITGDQNDQVFLPFDTPAGTIKAVLGRKSLMPNVFANKAKL